MKNSGKPVSRKQKKERKAPQDNNRVITVPRISSDEKDESYKIALKAPPLLSKA